MIIIKIYGPHYTLIKELSEEGQSELASLFEVDEEEIMIMPNESSLLYKGVEQGAIWSLVEILLPSHLRGLFGNAAKYLTKKLAQYSVHSIITSVYFDHDAQQVNINPDYPTTLGKEIPVVAQVDTYEEDNFDEDGIYEGDIFENLEEDLEKIKRKED